MPAERCPSSPGSMRLVILSDTHGNHRRLEMPEDADILIHAGDFTQLGKRSDAEDFNAWLGTLPYAHKLVVVGNHEEKADWRCTAADILTNATLLCNTGVNICGLNIFGCTFYWPVMPFFQPPYNMIPADTHVLISHGPARHHVDAGVGCPYMLTHIARVRPLLFVCGHIHEARGACVGRDESVATTTFVNAANGAPHDSAKRGNNHNRAACTFSKERSSSGGGGGSGGAAEAATCRSTVDVEVPRSRRQPVLATVRDWQPERLKSGVSKAMKALLAPVAATGANFTSRDALATGSGPAALHAGVEGNGSGGIVGLASKKARAPASGWTATRGMRSPARQRRRPRCRERGHHWSRPLLLHASSTCARGMSPPRRRTGLETACAGDQPLGRAHGRCHSRRHLPSCPLPSSPRLHATCSRPSSSRFGIMLRVAPVAPVALVTLRASVAMAALRQVRRALLRAATLTPARVMVGCTVRFVRLPLFSSSPHPTASTWCVMGGPSTGPQTVHRTLPRRGRLKLAVRASAGAAQLWPGARATSELCQARATQTT